MITFSINRNTMSFFMGVNFIRGFEIFRDYRGLYIKTPYHEESEALNVVSQRRFSNKDELARAIFLCLEEKKQ